MKTDFRYHVNDAEGHLLAGVNKASDGAMFVDAYGPGTTIRKPSGIVLWTEGQETQQAGQSYDHVSDVVHGRECDAVRRLS